MMNPILDQFTRPQTPFRPESAQDLFALCLARRLNEAPAVRHYADLLDRLGEGRLKRAYLKTMRSQTGGDLGWRFHRELDQTSGNGNGSVIRLLAIRIERRAVACACFHGDNLEFSDVRQLTSNREKAVNTAGRFVNWVLDAFPVDAAAMDLLPPGGDSQREALSAVIQRSLQERLLPSFDISRETLLEAYGYPALRSRQQLRDVVTTIWPVLAGTHAKVFIQDAAAVGLYAQVDRNFILNA